jgi:hypothetical protein
MLTITFRPRLRPTRVRVRSNHLMATTVPLALLIPTAILGAVGAIAAVVALVIGGAEA